MTRNYKHEDFDWLKNNSNFWRFRKNIIFHNLMQKQDNFFHIKKKDSILTRYNHTSFLLTKGNLRAFKISSTLVNSKLVSEIKN